MSLVQRPPHPSSFQPQCHRRHPSAPPAVLVQPTRTPGLLAMSKATPTTATSSRKASRSSPKTKHATAVAVMAPQHHAPAKSLVAAAAKPVPAERPNNRTTSSPERRKAHNKRTSPPPPRAPQAEALSTDPFFSAPTTIPNLSRPSGNLAKRRASQSNIAFPPPPFTPGHFGGMAKSAPTGLLATRPHFAICDDSSDDDFSLSPPATPVKNRRSAVDSVYAFEETPSFKASNNKTPKQHKRRVSTDVGGLIMGHWSGDEDSSPSSSIYGFVPTTPSRVSTPGSIYDEDDIRYAMPKSHSSPLAGCLPRPAF